jgi:tetratricopeptide (TPR) repeat protein
MELFPVSPRRPPCARDGGRGRSVAARLALLVATLTALAVGGVVPAQGLSPEAAALLDEARAAIEEAYLGDDPRTPDHFGWREGLVLGRAALGLNDDLDVRRFLGRAYGLVGWSIRSLQHFDVLLERGGSLDDPPDVVVGEIPSRELYAAAAADLGFARYGAGDLDGAVQVYERWFAAEPESLEALRWLGRLHLERLDPVAALPYWEDLAGRLPDDEAVAYFLGEARRGAAVGAEAAIAFRQGVLAYEAGDRAGALERFEAALAEAPEFADAAVWAGRSALELERPAVAVRHWQRAVQLRPDDGRAAYFLRVAQHQATFGVAAGRAFDAGLTAYERQQPEEAIAAFERAVAANDRFTEAWVWLARVRQELGRFDGAVEAWEWVTLLDPDDARARYFLNVARQQRLVRAEAASVFAEGIAAYEAADFATASRLLAETVAIDPNAVQAWIWLGRVAFGMQRFDEAARAFRRAAELDPSDDDVAFFAAEAARLAEAARVAALTLERSGEGDDADEGARDGGRNGDAGEAAP